VKKFDAEAGVSAFGFGAGGKTSSNSQVDKQGGDLGVCKSDSATEVSGCKAPIRLTLRPIRDGSNPEKEAMKAEDTDESLNAAGMVNAEDGDERHGDRRTRGGAGEVEGARRQGLPQRARRYDKLEPKRKSTDPKNAYRRRCARCA
jgi:hypothetical protein